MSDPDSMPRDPETIRDTIPIRPLPKWASRLLVTAALLVAVALGVLAARMMGRMASDPSVQERLEAVERMRRGEVPADSAADSLHVPAADTTTGDTP